MNIFDDLADPLGPPGDDPLNRVLARARRRRVIRRAAVTSIAVVAVAGVAVSANALRPTAHAVRVTGSTTSLPAPDSTTAPAPTSSPTSTTTTTTTAPASGLWSETHITISPTALGAVRIGMTLAEAQTAAGYGFDGTGDGAYYPTTLPAGFPHLFVRQEPGSVSCFGAEISEQSPNVDTVTTPEGFRLGDSVNQLKAIYGSRAQFVPLPNGGLSPRAGYVVTFPSGRLAFYVNPLETRVLGIKGGADVTPSNCWG